jgi:hypothetical protein
MTFPTQSYTWYISGLYQVYIYIYIYISSIYMTEIFLTFYVHMEPFTLSYDKYVPVICHIHVIWDEYSWYIPVRLNGKKRYIDTGISMSYERYMTNKWRNIPNLWMENMSGIYKNYEWNIQMLWVEYSKTMSGISQNYEWNIPKLWVEYQQKFIWYMTVLLPLGTQVREAEALLKHKLSPPNAQSSGTMETNGNRKLYEHSPIPTLYVGRTEDLLGRVHSFCAFFMATPPLPFLTSTLLDRSRPWNSGVPTQGITQGQPCLWDQHLVVELWQAPASSWWPFGRQNRKDLQKVRVWDVPERSGYPADPKAACSWSGLGSIQLKDMTCIYLAYTCRVLMLSKTCFGGDRVPSPAS